MVLPGLTSLAGTVDSTANFEALAGGNIQLANLTSVTSNNIELLADGLGSTLSAAALTSVTGSQGTLQQSNGGALSVANLATFTGGFLYVSGSSATLANLADIDSTFIQVLTGGTLSLPAVTSYQDATPFRNTQLEASGTGAFARRWPTCPA